MMNVAGITTTAPAAGQYPMTGPAATTANVKDVMAARASKSAESTAGLTRRVTAALTGSGSRVDVTI